MTEPESPIIDFYPKEFHIDMNGKKMLWQGVALLPFIDPVRLLDAMGQKYPELTEFENSRNEMGTDTIIVGSKHPLFDYLEGLYGKRKAKEVSLMVYSVRLRFKGLNRVHPAHSPSLSIRNEAKESLEPSWRTTRSPAQRSIHRSKDSPISSTTKRFPQLSNSLLRVHLTDQCSYREFKPLEPF